MFEASVLCLWVLAYICELLHWKRRSKWISFFDKGAAGVGMHEACVRRWKVKWMLGAKRVMRVCNLLTFDPPLLLSFLWQLPPICQEQRWLILAFLWRPAQSESRLCQLFISDLLVQFASADCRAAGGPRRTDMWALALRMCWLTAPVITGLLLQLCAVRSD